MDVARMSGYLAMKSQLLLPHDYNGCFLLSPNEICITCISESNPRWVPNSARAIYTQVDKVRGSFGCKSFIIAGGFLFGNLNPLLTERAGNLNPLLTERAGNLNPLLTERAGNRNPLLPDTSRSGCVSLRHVVTH